MKERKIRKKILWPIKNKKSFPLTSSGLSRQPSIYSKITIRPLRVQEVISPTHSPFANVHLERCQTPSFVLRKGLASREERRCIGGF